MFSRFPRQSRIQPEQQEQPEQKLTEEDISKLNNIKFWKDNNIDPINKKNIEPSIVPSSTYVKLYKKSIDILILILLRKSPSVILTIKDCKYIRKSLPNAHICINDGPLYDHLFTKYFIKKHIKKYDEKYRAYGTDIYLYLELYKILKRKLKPLPPQIIQNLKNNKILLSQNYLKNIIGSMVISKSSSSEFNQEDILSQNDILTNNIDYILFRQSELYIDKVIIRLDKDINNILNLKFTKENYYHVINSFTTLKFVEKIYKISNILNSSFTEDITAYINEYTSINDFFKKYLVDKNSSEYFHILEDIYNKIILLYDYYFPYFIHDGIYETNCIGTKDAITQDDFNYDTNNHAGNVTIIPDYTQNKIVNTCFLTEELFLLLLSDITYYIDYNKKSIKPHNRQEFTKGDINHIVEQLLIKLKNYNEDDNTNGLIFLKTYVFEIELKKVSDEIIKLQKKNDEIIELLKENMIIEITNLKEYLLNRSKIKLLNKLKINLQSLLKLGSIQIILKDPKFTYFIKAYLKANKNEISRVRQLKVFNFTNNYNEEINKNEEEFKKPSSEYKIIGKYSYFLNINLGTEENKRVFTKSVLDIPIFNKSTLNNTLRGKTSYTFLEEIKKNKEYVVDSLELLNVIENLENFKKKLINIPKETPKETYDSYYKCFFSIRGGRKKRIVNTTSNKKRGRKNKTI